MEIAKNSELQAEYWQLVTNGQLFPKVWILCGIPMTTNLPKLQSPLFYITEGQPEDFNPLGTKRVFYLLKLCRAVVPFCFSVLQQEGLSLCTSTLWTATCSYTLLKPKRHSLRCHGFVVHALLLRMHTNVVDFRVTRMKLTMKLTAWTNILGSMTTDHVITECDVWL